MAVLTRVPRNAAAPTYVTVQCDVCVAPWVASNPPEALRDNGWILTLDGASTMDVCPPCRRRRFASEVVKRPASTDLGTGRLPNLLVIGAAKCATNSLHSYLDAHPDINMSAVKEPNFFQDPDYRTRLGHYAEQFDGGGAIAGESSTAYTRYPSVPCVPERMFNLVPEARLIYIVRDPVERALSAFVEARSHGNEPRSVSEAFASLDDEKNSYMAGSKYALQMSQYLLHFPRQQLLILDKDELSAHPHRTMRTVYEFLDVDPTVGGDDFAARLNTRQDKREYSRVVRKLRDQPLLKVVYRLPPGQREQLLNPMRRLLSRQSKDANFSADLHAQVATTLHDDAVEFRKLADLPFETWSI